VWRIRKAVIIIFGAVPATILVFGAVVVLWIYRFQIFGPGPLSLLLSVVYLGMAIWGAVALWFSMSESTTHSNTIGLLAGLVILIPSFVVMVDSPAHGLARFGWFLLPAIVAIFLLVARLHCVWTRR